MSLGELSTEALQALIARVTAAGAAHIGPIADSVSDHPVVRAEIERCRGTGRGGMCAHLEQQASLIGNMREAGLLAPRRCFIEFGAGRGKLLHFVCVARSAVPS